MTSTQEKLRDVRAVATEDNRPTIKLVADLHHNVDAAIAALAHDPTLYQRDGELVRVVHAAEANGDDAETTSQIRPVQLATGRERCTAAARWLRKKVVKGEVKEEVCQPPDRVVAAALARGEYPGVRVLAGVTDAPRIRPDGSVLDTPGYDSITGLIYQPSCDVPAVKRVDQAGACAALDELCEVFQDFPFASHAARYVPIAAILTVLARPAINGATPLFAFDAPTPGSGKSLITDCVSQIATGRAAPRMTYASDENELEKLLGSVVLLGSLMANFDNIAGLLGSAPLDKVLTAEDRVALRVLGKSELREVAWRAVLTATGNNLVLGADTGRRTLVARLEPSMENPENRTGFRHPDLLAHVRANRGRLLAAALTILHSYLSEKRDDSALTWGSYMPWARIVAGAIVWAGGANVLDCRAASVGVRNPELDALAGLLTLLPAYKPEGATARQLINGLWPASIPSHLRDATHDALRDALTSLAPPKRPNDPPDPKALGKALAKHVGRVMDKVRLASKQPNKAEPLVWLVEPAGLAGLTGFIPTTPRERSSVSEYVNGLKTTQPSQSTQREAS